MEKFLNISNHVLTDEQIKDLSNIFKTENIEVVELPSDIKKKWEQLNPNNYQDICDDIFLFAKKNDIKHCHLAGFMPAVVYMAQTCPLFLYYSYSQRVSEERKVNEEIIKTSVFKHKGWYKYY